ncbi:MAG: hypothetical protein IPM53_02280 [Anaerolineaceae bacterium]|nr:hypothetical protein [Anaerolineaceae bacterium]
MQKYWLSLLILLSVTLAACGGQSPDQTGLTDLPVPTSPVIPPTYTPLPPGSQLGTFPVVTVTQAPLPTEVTKTPIPFGSNVVELRLTIPAIGLDRRLQGGVSSQIILVDESSGFSVQRDNQAGVLLDLQRVLPELELEPVPPGCDTCIRLSYNLPFSDAQGEGWLQDPVLLASLENYFTTALGPYFPAEAIVGLRRSATPYAPAHWVAVVADGRMFRWMAHESQVALVTGAPPALLNAFDATDPQALAQQYTAPCPGTALESLLVAGRSSERLIALVCPEYAISTTIQPLYVALDDALAELLAASDATLPRPPAQFPLDAVLQYNRLDGAHLTLFDDGTAVALTSGQPVTTTLGSSQVISLTTSLLESGVLRTGLTTFIAPESTAGVSVTPTSSAARSVLLVRGPDAVYDGQWFSMVNVPELAELNALLNEILLGGGTAVPPETPEGTPEATPDAANETPEPVATPSATPTDD